MWWCLFLRFGFWFLNNTQTTFCWSISSSTSKGAPCKLHHPPQQKCPSWLADVEQRGILPACQYAWCMCVCHVNNMLNKHVSLKQRGGQPLHTSDCESEMVCVCVWLPVLGGLKSLGRSWQKNQMVPSLKWEDPLSILYCKKHVNLGVG